MKARTVKAFTLLELLVVIGLIAALSFFLASGLIGSSKSMGLQSAQATLANLVIAARTKAIASGKAVRVLINDNPTNTAMYRRRLVLVEENGADWAVAYAVTLPDNIYLLPRESHMLTGVFPNLNDWKATNGNTLGSTGLNAGLLSFAHESASSENWEYLDFTSRGTRSGQGSLVLAVGGIIPPALVSPGNSPIQLTDPRNVRGMQISSYGVLRLINDRTGF